MKTALLVAALLLLNAPAYAQSNSAPASVFKLGFITPLTGTRASIGEDARAGAALALADLEAQGAISKTAVAISFEDSQGDPNKGVQAYQKLRRDGIRFIITQNSNVSLPILPLAKQDRVLQLAITTTSDRYSTPNDLSFRTNSSTRFEASTLAAFLAARTQAAPGEIGVATMQDEYPITLRDHLLSELESRRLVPALSEDFLPQETDFRALITKLKAKKIAYVFCLGYQTQCGYFVKQSRELAFEPKLFLTNTPVNNREFFDVAGRAAAGVLVSYPSPDSSHPAAARFQERFKRSVNFFSSNAYDGVLLAVQTWKSCQPAADPDCWARALYATKDFHGLSGHKSFDDLNGDMQDTYSILVASEGRFVPLTN